MPDSGPRTGIRVDDVEVAPRLRHRLSEAARRWRRRKGLTRRWRRRSGRGPRYPVATAVDEASPISDDDCIVALERTKNDYNYIERELDRWKILWQDHEFFAPVRESGGRLKLKYDHTGAGPNKFEILEVLLKELNGLIVSYKAADTSAACIEIRNDNEDVYRDVEFIKKYDEKLEKVLAARQAILWAGRSYGDPADPHYEEMESLMLADRQMKARREERADEESNARTTIGRDGLLMNTYDPATGSHTVKNVRGRTFSPGRWATRGLAGRVGPGARSRRRRKRPRKKTRAKKRPRSRSTRGRRRRRRR